MGQVIDLLLPTLEDWIVFPDPGSGPIQSWLSYLRNGQADKSIYYLFVYIFWVNFTN